METDATYRGTVYPWQCDHVGHMNIMWYVGKFDEANWNLFAPRYLHPEVPGFALFGALALVRLVPKPKVVGGIAVVITLALLALWAHLASVTPASL